MSCAFAEGVFAFEKLSYDVKVNQIITLNPVAQGIDGKVSFSLESSDYGIVDVRNNQIKGIKPGEATITATGTAKDGKVYSAVCTVNVIRPISSIKVNKTNVTLASMRRITDTDSVRGDERFCFIPEVQIYPEDATYKDLEWETSDWSIAYVENGAIYGYRAGTATVTGKAKDGSGKSVKITVTVPSIYTTADSIHISEEGSVIFGYQTNASGISLIDYETNGAFQTNRLDDESGLTMMEIVPVKQGSGYFYFRSGGRTKRVTVTIGANAVRGEHNYPTKTVTQILKYKDHYMGQKVTINCSNIVKTESKPYTDTYSYAGVDPAKLTYDGRHCGIVFAESAENNTGYFAFECDIALLLNKGKYKVSGEIIGYTTFSGETGLSYECPLLGNIKYTKIK